MTQPSIVIRGGTVVGRSDAHGAYPSDSPVTPENFAATIYHALGIDPELRLPDRQGRPVPMIEAGRPLLDLFG